MADDNGFEACRSGSANPGDSPVGNTNKVSEKNVAGEMQAAMAEGARKADSVRPSPGRGDGLADD